MVHLDMIVRGNISIFLPEYNGILYVQSRSGHFEPALTLELKAICNFGTCLMNCTGD